MEGGHCVRDVQRDFSARVPPQIERFEARVLARHFPGKSLLAWERRGDYHAYYNVTRLSVGRPFDAVWAEYVHWPAPSWFGRRDQPVADGDVSLVTAAPRGRGGVRVPLAGGYVTHYVDAERHAVCNATNRLHLLDPGYIVRWLSVHSGVTVSNTLGRGVGYAAHANVTFGVRMFHELDLRIKAALGAR